MSIYEKKYVVHRVNRDKLISLLNYKCKIPEKFSRAKLRTYYFDDREHTSYFDSRDGNYNKKKYRLREYINPDVDGALYSLEVKKRSGLKTSKIKKLITNKLPENYRVTTFSRLIETFEELEGESFLDIRNEMSGKELFYDALISYERNRYEDYYHSARINIDTNIRVYRNKDSYNHNFNSVYSFENDILEIKSSEQYWAPHYLKTFPMQYGSFSKFLVGKEKVAENI